MINIYNRRYIMARLVETVAVIKISRLLKDNEVMADDADTGLLAQLQEIAVELVGDNMTIVEVIVDNQ